MFSAARLNFKKQPKTLNYKHLFPTFRNRFVFVKKQLSAFGPFENALNLGTGEGDYDRMIAEKSKKLIGCDVNEDDLKFARELNFDVKNLNYQIDDALNLSFKNANFDLVVSSEVIEHVGKPDVMMREIGRVLKSGGVAIITFPSEDFPFTYDPINRIHQWISPEKGRLIAQGGYAFGHEYLISPKKFRAWAAENDLEIVVEKNSSGHLVGLAEIYWTGIVQKIFKKNNTNLTEVAESSLKLRPTSGEPALSKLTDIFCNVDFFMFKNSSRSVGKGFVLRKK
jgi:ubiquinone/menaquinone biosynthesis C-methylase UbiE